MFPNKRIEEYYRLYSQLLSFNNLSWWLIDLADDPNVFYCNKTMCNTFSLDDQAAQHSVSETCPIAGDYNKNIAIKSSDKANEIFSEYHQLRKGIIDEFNNRFPYYHAELGETLFFVSKAKALLKDEFGNAVILFGIIEQETQSAELYKKVKTDSLTGLYNRREFDSQIEFLMNIATRKKHCISLILCDIDHFKLYNDELGHYAGDECLIEVARSISDVCIRQSDVACRYGGEEFAIIVYGDEQDASRLAEAIRKEVYVKSIPHPARSEEPVSVSVGYFSTIPSSSCSPRLLIECADKALYQAKRLGRNRCEKFEG